MTRRVTDPRIDGVLRHLDPPAGTMMWHGGPTVLRALRGVSPEVAAWRPDPDRHCIWGLALHGAYWDDAVRRRLTGDGRGAFARTPRDFPDVPAPPTKKAWDADRRLVRSSRARLLQAIRDFDARRLDDPTGHGSYTWADLLTGILLHDTYHAGQIVMLKRLAASDGR